MQEQIDYSALVRAVASLKLALDEFGKDESNDFVRDSCIQRFEYCYDLSAKMLKRYLSSIAANPGEVQEMTFQTMIREAFTKGVLLNSWEQWWKYRDNRNKTSHGYDEAKAIAIVNELTEFYAEVAYLTEQLVASHEN